MFICPSHIETMPAGITELLDQTLPQFLHALKCSMDL